jgi:hypothetical protein
MGFVGSFHRHSWYQDLETSSSSSYTYLLLPQGVALSCYYIDRRGKQGQHDNRRIVMSIYDSESKGLINCEGQRNAERKEFLDSTVTIISTDYA